MQVYVVDVLGTTAAPATISRTIPAWSGACLSWEVPEIYDGTVETGHRPRGLVPAPERAVWSARIPTLTRRRLHWYS